ncbi:hypothetical protein TNCV_4141601 [Trichonephila clavipes]|nr:hypothetical protein TNCV_4141601 [Trichonephila clavipes]
METGDERSPGSLQTHLHQRTETRLKRQHRANPPPLLSEVQEVTVFLYDAVSRVMATVQTFHANANHIAPYEQILEGLQTYRFPG